MRKSEYNKKRPEGRLHMVIQGMGSGNLSVERTFL